MEISAGNMQLIKIWGEDHEPWMQALHCVLVVGALLGPLIATPFLSHEDNIAGDVTSSHGNKMNALYAKPTTRVKYAYFIAGLLLHFHCLLFLILHLRGNKTCLISKNNKEKMKEDKLHNKCFEISFASLVFVFNWMYCILEITCGNYLTSYSVEELNWSKTSGATLTSVFWASFTFERGTGIFIVRLVSTEILIFSMSILTILSLIPVVFFVHIHYSIMWMSTVLFGFFISTIYASGLTFANMYIPFTGGIGGLFIAAGSLGDLTCPIFIVPLFDTHGMKIFVVLLFVASVVMFVVYLGSWAIGKKHGKRNLKDRISLTESGD